MTKGLALVLWALVPLYLSAWHVEFLNKGGRAKVSQPDPSGRHIMGSQISDYWKDPLGNEFERWTYCDRFTASDRPTKQTMQALLVVQWRAIHK